MKDNTGAHSGYEKPGTVILQDGKRIDADAKKPKPLAEDTKPKSKPAPSGDDKPTE